MSYWQQLMEEMPAKSIGHLNVGGMTPGCIDVELPRRYTVIEITAMNSHLPLQDAGEWRILATENPDEDCQQLGTLNWHNENDIVVNARGEGYAMNNYHLRLHRMPRYKARYVGSNQPGENYITDVAFYIRNPLHTA